MGWQERLSKFGLKQNMKAAVMKDALSKLPTMKTRMSKVISKGARNYPTVMMVPGTFFKYKQDEGQMLA
jgi:hypothetical protein